jgi:hypothetical protein
MKRLPIFLVVICFSLNLWGQDSLDKLASDFWIWRAQYQPFNGDDVPRIERPRGLKRSWSEASVARQRADLAGFEDRWKKLSLQGPVQEQVDYRLIGSALARVHWELDWNRRWQRDPTFYVEQSMGAVTDALLAPPPFDEARSREVITRLENIPSILEEAKANLKEPAAPFAKLAVGSLAGIRGTLQIVSRDVSPMLAGDSRKELVPAVEKAAASLESFRAWLEQQLPSMTEHTAVGKQAYAYFFKNVALYPFSPEQLLAMSRQEWARAVAFEEMEQERNQNVPELKMFATLDDQIARTREAEAQVRRFLVEHRILSIPDDFPHYTARPLPEYLAVLGAFGELDDFTGPLRLHQDGVRWTPKPSDRLGYFENSIAHDPRPILVHEGIPGHFMQLSLGWRNSDPIRRHYYDSGANEGLGFYAEEMMLQAGFFDDSPHTREVLYNFMRLRALRVEVDIKLASGEFTVDQAAGYLASKVPMNPDTARSEAAMFSTQPGLAIAYQAGKLQITQFFADARLRAGNRFDVKAFNDFVWRNGNVPIELQRQEWFQETHPETHAGPAKPGK